ncbi:uncharacterized protein [Physcomitrium patens]|uniref:MYND-type domain-containing protein n=1 Tax=Physcomitrium patens TaxID=3218 RepID=A0A2K1JE60_PHYPA|nr:uncharacterized protein LOC112292868 [Physcomitrium patens]PNR39823.1 hypothetical protein PHYPA_020103 [Physcomitrium patens]|eukprot:XP_024397548.1 uncharacterized protein LOC112292868 [Physcomitrella patens]
MEGFDSFREISGKEFDRLRVMAEKDPILKKNLEMYEQISGRNLSEAVRKEQEENDKRWDIMVADQEKLPKEEQPRTMGAFSDMLEKYGFKPPTPVPEAERSKEGDFGDFMNAYGTRGMDLMADYEMKSAPKVSKCEECRKDASMRCKQCGQPYCSKECQTKAWPTHKRICKLVAAQRSF